MAVTPRLALYKPVGSDLVSVEDHLNEQLSIIDNKAFAVLTNDSTTPPVADFLGQEWFAPDTEDFHYWNGAAWIVIPFIGVGSSTGPGRKAFTAGSHTGNTLITGPSQDNGPLFPTTLNVTAGKNYRVVVITVVRAVDTTNFPECYLYLRWAPGAVVTNTGGNIGKYLVTISSFVLSNLEHSYVAIDGIYTAAATQQITIGLFMAKTAGQSGQMCFLGINHGQVAGSQQFLYVEEL